MSGSPLIRTLDRGAVVFLVLVVAVAIFVPALNLLLPPSLPLHVPTYMVAAAGRFGNLEILQRRARVRLVDVRVAGVPLDLVDGASRHHVTSEEQPNPAPGFGRDGMAVELPLGAARHGSRTGGHGEQHRSASPDYE